MTKLSDRFGVKVTSGNNSLQWVGISASTTIENSYGYFVDTSTGAVTLTCPANPVLGDSFGIKAQDLTNTLIIDGNGNNIEGSTTLNVDVLGAGMTYVFSDNGWVNVTEIGGGESDMTVPEWSATYTYSINDMVNYSGTLYKSLADNNTNNQPDTSTSDWEEYASGEEVTSIPVWDSQITYSTNNMINYNGILYKSLTDNNTNNQPDTSTSDWDEYASGGGGDTVPEWSSTYTYSTNDIINYNGTLYKSMVDDNTNHLPDETDSTYWEVASSSGETGAVELENYEYICDGTESSVTIDVSSFESDDLEILCNLKTDRDSYTWDRLDVLFNNDATESYDSVCGEINSEGGVSSTSEDGKGLTYLLLGSIMGADAPSNLFPSLRLTLPGYKSTVRYTAIYGNGTTYDPTKQYAQLIGGIYLKQDAITSIKFMPHFGTKFIAGSRIKIYGKYTEGDVVASSSSSVVENIGFTEIKTDRDFEESPGSWRPIYRKMIDFGALPNATSKIVAHNVSNISKFVKCKGMTDTSMPIPYVDVSSLSSCINIIPDSTNITITTGIDRSSLNALVTIEYTKTTDTATSSPRFT